MSSDAVVPERVWPVFVTFLGTLVSAIVLALSQVVSMPLWLVLAVAAVFGIGIVAWGVIGYRVARSTGTGFWRSLGRSVRAAVGVLFDFSF